MGIFTSIKNAIFGKDEKDKSAMPKGDKPIIATGTASPRTADSTISEVDVGKVLEAKAARTDQKLNWRSSIVDLMKLLGIDSSLDNRKELARELGYTGELNGSAEMNMWLHKATMNELAKHGGRVPAELRD